VTGQPHRPGPRSVRVGENLRQLRTEAGLSQAQLAERVGWSQNVVAKIELAKTNMRVEQLLDLVDGLECLPSDLLAGTYE
jgi:transcriptional regulator with XRE-family HTH domain